MGVKGEVEGGSCVGGSGGVGEGSKWVGVC